MFAKVDVSIVEQPARDSIRFRYLSDDRSSGSIMGVKSNATKPTFPAISISTFDYSGPVVVIASCVTKDKPYKPHPHSLVGENCTKGICRIDYVSNSSSPTVITYPNLGIECSRHQDVEKNLIEREKSNIDPFRTGFSHKNKKKDINMHELRICFQVFLTPDAKRLPVKPIVSETIRNNLKALPDLVIVDISDVTSSVNGGKKIMIFSDKILKDDIKIRFYQEDRNKAIIFEELVVVQSKNIHRQYAFAFYTPKYKFLDIDVPVDVYIQLVRPSDNSTSESLSFQYIPDVSNRLAKGKKRKIEESQELFQFLQAFSENQTDKTSATISPKVEFIPNINFESDEEDNEQQMICEQSSTTSSYSNQLQPLYSQQHLHRIDQSQPNRPLCQISQPSCYNQIKKVNYVRQNQETCPVSTTQVQPSCGSQQNYEVHQVNNNLPLPSCSTHFQQVDQSQPNCEVHQLNNKLPQPSCSKHVHQVDQTQHNRQIYTLSSNQPQRSCGKHLPQVDHIQQNCEVHQMNSNVSSPSCSNHLQQINQHQQHCDVNHVINNLTQPSCINHHQQVDQGEQNRQYQLSHNHHLQPSCSNHLPQFDQIRHQTTNYQSPCSNHVQQVVQSQQNCDILQICPNSDLASNTQLRQPHANCYDSASEYVLNRNLWHEIQISSPILSQSIIRQYEQGVYPIEIPSTESDLKIDQDIENLSGDFVQL